MENREILQDLSSLPAEAQRQVADYVAFLKQRYAQKRSGKKPAARKPLAKEGFVGMWRDRRDLADSGEWVRNVRKREWRTQ